MTDPVQGEQTPGAIAVEGIAGWAEARRSDGELPMQPGPRTVAAGAIVELREVTGETVRAICILHVAPAQRRFVAPNAVSIAEAHFAPTAWFRAVYADDIPVGFVMLSLEPEKSEYHLWRFMIADGFQGHGFGKAAIGKVVEFVRTQPGATALITSWVPGEGSPEGFYLGLGFTPTGEVDDGEVVGRLPL
jgi:diamine N-acetyltransferase